MIADKINIIEGYPVLQNKQDFVVGVFTIKQILKFTKYTTRLIVAYDDDGTPIYNNQIQRFVENSRVQKIADFLINDPDATFPTNLVLHIPLNVISSKEDDGEKVEIEIDQKVFREIEKENGDVYISIIDGQHRIKGIEVAIDRLQVEIKTLQRTLRISENIELRSKLDYYIERLEDLKNIKLVVTFFIDKTLEYQAMIFSTINRTQKRVSADLVSSLFGLNADDTPQKTALQVVLSLNGHPKSPFFKRIKLYGGSYSKETSPPLSQATMVSSIVKYISENAREAENDRHKKRKQFLDNKGSKYLPFRLWYANNADEKISDCFFYFFNAIKRIFLKDRISYWEFENKNKATNIFHTTVGYDSLLRIMVDILLENKNIAPEKINFEGYLHNARNLNIGNINRYSFNNRGKKYLYLDISLAIWPPDYVNNPRDKREKELLELEKEG